MKQQQFETEHAPLWAAIGDTLEGKPGHAAALPSQYRRLCQCLALAGQRGYSPALTDTLQQMVGACHQRLYGAVAERPQTLMRVLVSDFPRQVRAEWRLLLLASLVFWGVGAAVGLLVWIEPHWLFSFASAEHLAEMHAMYKPGKIDVGRGGSEGDLLMFGIYVWNNISIGFRTFAGGLFCGIPALISVGRNGIEMGVVASWLSQDPATRATFWPFVVTHASFELSGLLLSAVAGLRVGLSLLRPGRLSRRHALWRASHDMFPVIVGAAMLTFIAAFFEAFWSASTVIPPAAKYTVGALCWSLLALFFACAGRRKG